MCTTGSITSDNWSGPQGEKWAEFQDQLDDVFADVTRLVLQYAAPKAGEAVLDIGCGGGAQSLAVAKHIGPTGKLLGVDISATLIALARQTTKEWPNITFECADAQTAALPEGAFDLVTSRFGVMFFADPALAFANIAQAVKENGRFVMGAWAPAARNPWWRIPAKIAQSRMGSVAPPPPNSPGPMGLADAEYARKVLTDAGLSEVEITEQTAHLTHPGGATGAAALSVRIGAAARTLDIHNAGQSDRDAVEAGMAEAFQDFVSDGVLRIPASINVISARKP